MPIQFIPALSYALISTFTPGPANISSTSVALLHGYKNSLPFQLGLALGVFLEMFIIGGISATLVHLFPAIEPILRYIGAAYILYLAYGIFKASYTFNTSNETPFGFFRGLLLQLLNPKLIVYAFTLFSAFLASVTENIALLFFAALILATISFTSTSLWAFFGTTIKTYLKNPRVATIVNILLALSLVYTAIAITGLI